MADQDKKAVNGKGDKDRTKDYKKYRDNYNKIFNKKTRQKQNKMI